MSQLLTCQPCPGTNLDDGGENSPIVESVSPAQGDVGKPQVSLESRSLQGSDSLSQLWYNGPPNPILIIKAPIVEGCTFQVFTVSRVQTSRFLSS